jgi:hypothetical protein
MLPPVPRNQLGEHFLLFPALFTPRRTEKLGIETSQRVAQQSLVIRFLYRQQPRRHPKFPRATPAARDILPMRVSTLAISRLGA